MSLENYKEQNTEPQLLRSTSFYLFFYAPMLTET